MPSLEERMRRLEKCSNFYLPIRAPVIVRVDGKCFRTLTKKLGTNFDNHLANCMNSAAIELCKEFGGSRFAYVCSDEISLLLTDFENRNSQAFLDYRTNKLNSISASLASVQFTVQFGEKALFDSRSISVPMMEVVNYFIWRQTDYIRNNISSLAREHFSHKDLKNKNKSQMIEMLKSKGVGYEEQKNQWKYGRCIIKDENHNWKVDEEIPLFRENKDYIECLF